MMEALTVSFASTSDEGSYRLLELTKELVDVFESNSEENNLSIRGRDEDEAVLCTGDKTYSIKAVTLSNAYCILTPPSGSETGDAVIRDFVKQTIEVSPSIPKTHRLLGILKGQIYDEGGEEVDPEVRAGWIPCSDVRQAIQASDEEFKQALREKRILIIDGFLRPISQSYLQTSLELMLNTLVSLCTSTLAVPVVEVIEVLQADHDIPRTVMLQVMAWFGELSDPISSVSPATTWKMNVQEVARQIGLGILSQYRENPVQETEFMPRWRSALGDSFEADATLELLKGNVIRSKVGTLKYFPSSELRATPQERFADLFLTQSSWRAEEIAPFLEEIAFDSKERDKLLMKYSRTTVDRNGNVLYCAKNVPVT